MEGTQARMEMSTETAAFFNVVAYKMSHRGQQDEAETQADSGLWGLLEARLCSVLSLTCSSSPSPSCLAPTWQLLVSEPGTHASVSCCPSFIPNYDSLWLTFVPL